MTNNLMYELWEEYYPKVYGYFYRRLENKVDVEDLTSIVMERYLHLHSDPEKLERVANKHAYLWKIASNQLYHFIKNKQKGYIEVGLHSENFEGIVEVENHRSNFYSDKIECLLDCIKQSLKNNDSKIVLMSFIEEKNSKEIGLMLNLSPENVRKRLSRSISKLKSVCRSIWQKCNS